VRAKLSFKYLFCAIVLELQKAKQKALDLQSLLGHLITLHLLQAPRQRGVQLGVEPAPSTMQAHNDLKAYFQRVIGLIALMIMNLQGRSNVNAAADSTGLSTNM